MTHPFETQLEAVVTEYETALNKSKYEDASDVLNDIRVSDLRTRCISAIERASGSNSVYYNNIIEIRKIKTHGFNKLGLEIGVAKGLLSDIQNDYLKSLEEILHSDIFADFLEMASHLLNNGYKDAAAVIASGTLEIHIKKLCNKFGIGTSTNNKPRKTEDLNANLTKQKVYSKLDQKNITAWLDLRNKAAHGQYSEYDKQQVQLLVNSIQNFITRNPA